MIDIKLPVASVSTLRC